MARRGVAHHHRSRKGGAEVTFSPPFSNEQKEQYVFAVNARPKEQSIADRCKEIGLADSNFYRWRDELTEVKTVHHTSVFTKSKGIKKERIQRRERMPLPANFNW